MPHFFAVICLFSALLLRGQSSINFPNLVKNPSFEERAVLDPDQTISVVDSVEEFIGWDSPTIIRAEIYSVDKYGYIEDPTDLRGQRNFKAKTGSHVAKIDPYGYKIIKKRQYEKRSYLQGELLDSMEVGQKYYFGFWTHFHCFSTSNIAISFTTAPIYSDTAIRLPFKPHARLTEINNYDVNKIWHLTVDSFIADRPYCNFIIGNFFRNDSTGLGGSKDFGHYVAFIDDIFVIKAKSNLMQPKKEAPQITKISLPKVLNKVQFLYNSTDFEPNSLPQLDSAVSILKKYPTIEIVIKGHTSSEGDAGYNQELSERRAEAVKNYLIQNGIETKRLTTKGLGEIQPLVSDDSEENKRINRRIKFEILKD